MDQSTRISMDADAADRPPGAGPALFAFMSVFALRNRLRVASIVAADQGDSSSRAGQSGEISIR
jgi:hypothetical protein